MLQDDQSMSPASRKLKDHLDQMSIRHHLSSLERSISGLGHQFVVQNACLGDLSEGMESGFKYLETRINKQEQRIKDLSGDVDVRCSTQPEDTVTSFKLVVECYMNLEDQINAHFNLADTRIDKVDSYLDKVASRLNQVDTRLDKLEATMATLKEEITVVKEDLKNDMTAMEERILDTIKQLFMTGNAQKLPTRNAQNLPTQLN
jgi:ribosome-associated translation inhibitor RaiA